GAARPSGGGAGQTALCKSSGAAYPAPGNSPRGRNSRHGRHSPVRARIARRRGKGKRVMLSSLKRCLIAVGLVVVGSTAVSAADYPTRPVRWIVPYPAGGSTDILARIIGQYLSERLGHPVLIENRPGGGNHIRTETALTAAADGSTRRPCKPPHRLQP